MVRYCVSLLALLMVILHAAAADAACPPAGDGSPPAVANGVAGSLPRGSAPARGAPCASARCATSSAPPVAITHPPAVLLQDAQSLPQLWLKRIQLMKSEGKVKEAEEELAKFRKRYPDYPLPEELKDKK